MSRHQMAIAICTNNGEGLRVDVTGVECMACKNLFFVPVNAIGETATFCTFCGVRFEYIEQVREFSEQTKRLVRQEDDDEE